MFASLSVVGRLLGRRPYSRSRRPAPAAEQVVLDLRSDTVTRPTAGMQRAMIKALQGPLGDDVIDGDATVMELEQAVADMCGKAAGLFCTSGTMTNQLALTCQLNRLESLVCDARAHIFTSEAGGIAFHSQAQAIPVSVAKPTDHLTAEQVRGAALSGDVHYATTRLVAVENTLHGMVYPLDELQRLDALCAAADPPLALHLDGARLCNAAVACEPTAPGNYLRNFCRPFATVSLCLSKGLGCPVGSVLVGPADLIARARHLRKAFGGGWRQAGVLAAAGLYAVQHHVQRLADDHNNAALIANKLRGLDFQLVYPVHTNMVFVTDPHQRLHRIRDRLLADHGIAISPSSESKARLVTHMHIGDRQLDAFFHAMDTICADLRAAVC